MCSHSQYCGEQPTIVRDAFVQCLQWTCPSTYLVFPQSWKSQFLFWQEITKCLLQGLAHPWKPMKLPQQIWTVNTVDCIYPYKFMDYLCFWMFSELKVWQKCNSFETELVWIIVLTPLESSTTAKALFFPGWGWVIFIIMLFMPSTSYMYYVSTWIWTWFRSSPSAKAKPDPGDPQPPPLPRPCHPHQGGRPPRARVEPHSTPLNSHLPAWVIIEALAGGGSSPSPPQHPPPHHIPTPPHYLKGYWRIQWFSFSHRILFKTVGELNRNSLKQCRNAKARQKSCILGLAMRHVLAMRISAYMHIFTHICANIKCWRNLAQPHGQP